MNYKEVIEAKYSREAWQGLLYDIFHNKVKFWRTPTPIHVSSRLAKEALSLGNISLSDGETIAVYEVELNEKVDIERNRHGIRDILTRLAQYGLCWCIRFWLPEKRKCTPLLICK